MIMLHGSQPTTTGIRIGLIMLSLSVFVGCGQSTTHVTNPDCSWSSTMPYPNGAPTVLKVEKDENNLPTGQQWCLTSSSQVQHLYHLLYALRVADPNTPINVTIRDYRYRLYFLQQVTLMEEIIISGMTYTAQSPTLGLRNVDDALYKQLAGMLGITEDELNS